MTGLLHGDINECNIVIKEDDSNQIYLAGLIDFGEMVLGPAVLDIAIFAISIILMNRSHDLDLLHIASLVLQGYCSSGVTFYQRDLELLYLALPARCSQLIVMCKYDAIQDPDNSEYILSDVNSSLVILRDFYTIYSISDFVNKLNTAP